MRQARRRFFVESALLCALSRLTPSRAALPRSIPLPDATLRAYVDVLIPADDTPRATALGVDKKLLVMAKARPDYHRLLERGLDWLNTQAQFKHGRNFAQLDEPSRDAIVGQAATAGYGTLPRVFFEQTRADAFFHYYGHPESWRGIVQYRGPTQPLGFLDYAQPPRTSR